jgi:aspartate carbamoyltransferase
MGYKTTKKPSSKFHNQSIISIQQFNKTSINELFNLAEKLTPLAKEAKPSKILAGRIVVLLFYEPSTRTLSSFDAAVKQLGGQTIVISNPNKLSSVSKGESFEDTIKTLEAYSDAIVLRHPLPGFAEKAANIVKTIPIINAGDGIGEHPTQSLLDLYTINKHKDSLSDLKGVVAGDLLNGRTVHSLLHGLSLYKNNRIWLLSPRKLRLQRNLINKLKTKGLYLKEIESIDQIPKGCDFWYWTRVQKERFASLAEYSKFKDSFLVNKALLDMYGSSKTLLLHPLPRVSEMNNDLDDDPRSVFLKDQVRNGMYIRMALLSLILTGK